MRCLAVEASACPGLSWWIEKFSVPTSLVVDLDGNVLVSEVANARVQVFGPDRAFLFEISPRLFAGPHGLAFDADGTLYIADTGNNVGRKFRPVYAAE